MSFKACPHGKPLDANCEPCAIASGCSKPICDWSGPCAAHSGRGHAKAQPLPYISDLKARAVAWKLCAKTYFVLVEKERKALRWALGRAQQAETERDAAFTVMAAVPWKAERDEAIAALRALVEEANRGHLSVNGALGKAMRLLGMQKPDGTEWR